METMFYTCLFTTFMCLHLVSANSIICGNKECRGGSPYCCETDDGTIGCCWDPFVYQLWWFWLVWIIIFFLILGCFLSCWRRRRAQYRYVVMSNSEYPTYGTVVHAAPTRIVHNSQGYAAGPPQPHATAPVKPPSYATSEATKPPPYSG